MAPRWWFLCKPKHVGAASIILICFKNSTFFYVVCISLIIKWLILLMHGYNHEDSEGDFKWIPNTSFWIVNIKMIISLAVSLDGLQQTHSSQRGQRKNELWKNTRYTSTVQHLQEITSFTCYDIMRALRAGCFRLSCTKKNGHHFKL